MIKEIIKRIFSFRNGRAMKDNELIAMAKEVPYQYWWNIEALIDEAESDETVEELRLIMRKKELHEQYKANCL